MGRCFSESVHMGLVCVPACTLVGECGHGGMYTCVDVWACGCVYMRVCVHMQCGLYGGLFLPRV